MKAMPALLAVAVLGITACGGASNDTKSASQESSGATAGGSVPTLTTSRPASAESYFENDGDDDDNDRHGKGPDIDDRAFLDSYGSDADQADTQSVTRLVKSYYGAAAAGDGTKACSLLYPSLAVGLTEGQGRAAQGDGGSACAKLVSLLFRRQHRQLAADYVATMVVTTVRVKDNLGIAVLGFKAVSEGEILVEREGGTWKIDALFDSELP